jgi:membrane protease YdiL (CAAX protease family)
VDSPSDQGEGKGGEVGLPLKYFLLVSTLAVPFWLFGGKKSPLPINLPIGALATFVPMIAASILSYQQHGSQGLKDLFKKALDYKKIKNRIWYLPALFLMPLIGFLSYLVMRWIGLPLPDPVQVPLLAAPLFLIMFLIGDTGEELGWMGYAIDPMQNRWGPFKAGLILGIFWVIWHTIPWVQTGNAPAWIASQGLFSVALRILMVWIYNHTGKSVFAATLVHVTANLSWALFPNYGSHYNPLIISIITLLVVGFLLGSHRLDSPLELSKK